MQKPRILITYAVSSLLATLAIAVAVAGAAPAGSLAPGRAAAREATLQRALDRVVAAGVPGAALLVRVNGRTIRLTSGYGNLKPRTTMRANDRFRVGSVTKAFVATVVLQLVAERKLALEDTVAQWLPGVVPNGKRITVLQLLGHTSGLFDYGGDAHFVEAAYRNPLRDWSPREIVAIAVSHRPSFAPGTRWGYANTNYYVLGLIVEAATRQPLGAELRRRILEPLHLKATSFDTAPRIAGHHAHGYFLSPLEDVSIGSPSVVWAAGALVSDGEDLARFFNALLGGRLLPPAELRSMETIAGSTPLFSYGLGLEKVATTCGAVWGHTGAMPGYSTYALSSKDGRRQVIVLVNGTHALGTATSNGFRGFGPPERAGRAIDRVVQIASCG
jgi:D-alanyl-D-alanine carboxypeptidase